MKRLIFVVALTALASWTPSAWAQKPKLDKMTFRVNGQTKTCVVGNVKVSLTLVFNMAMKKKNPAVKFGLADPPALNVPMYDTTWVDEKTFFANFDINGDVPATADGLYKFLVFGAMSTTNVTMDSTLSDALKNADGDQATLRISRAGKLKADTNKVDFGTIKAGAADTTTVIVKNVTCSDIVIARFTLSESFTILNAPIGVRVLPDANLTLNLRFSSSVRKKYAGLIQITYTSDQQPEESIFVQLIGVTRGPELAFDPKTPVLNFGTLVVGDSTVRTFRVTNLKAEDETLTDTLKITGIALNPAAGYRVTPLSLMIAPGDTKNVTVRFKPTAAGEFRSSLDFATNDLIKPLGKISLPVSGSGQILTPPPKPDSLIVAWPGGRRGYTNADSLAICLNVSLAEVQEVRWKLSLRPSPPASPNDTTGTARISNNRPCFKIPLRNFLSPGRFYFYVWLLGKNGVASDYHYSLLYYDITPPSFKAGREPDVSVGWTGGVYGYTNADNLTICWEASDSSGVTAARWIFLNTTKPAKEPGQFNKNSIAGGNGKYCVTIPLKDVIAPNQRWYLYFWLVDGSGNSGYAGARGIYFNYDLIPPRANDIPPLVFNNWLGRFNNRTLKLKFGLPSGAADAKKVFWKFWNIGITGAADTLSRAGNTVSFLIPLDARIPCGYDSLQFWFADSAGNVEPANFAKARYRFDICAPKVKRPSRAEAVAQKQKVFEDNVAITDQSLVDTNSVTIFYRFGGSRGEDLTLSRPWRKIKRFRTAAGDSLSLQVKFPSQALTTRGLEYRITVKDTINNSLGEGTWIPVRVRVSGEGEFRTDRDGKPVAQANGSDASGYRLISIPFWLDKPKAKDVLEDDLGPYQKSKWRLVEYRPERAVTGKNPYVDYDSKDLIAEFAPGNAFFLIVRDSNKVIDSGGGVTVSTVKDTTLLELKDGWNLFGNPFNFPISIDSLKLHNSKLRRQIFTLERTWNLDDTIEPWKGYAIKVERIGSGPITLTIPPVATKPRRGNALSRTDGAAGEWTLQISAKAGAALDTINWAGTRRNAAEEYDAFDLVEPPVIGNYISVAFDNSRWSDLAMDYTADFRPSGHDLYEWPVKVASNFSQSEITLDFKGLADLPSEYEAYLVDEAYGIARNLKRNPSYRLVSTDNGVERSLQLLVGKPEALQKRTGGIALVPKAFELSQNFPNPFATQQSQAFTAIRYALPKSATVTVDVYNMLGQKVRTLVNRQFQDADYYITTWNGRDEAGKEVASGVYVYRILAETGSERFTSTKKLLLIK